MLLQTSDVNIKKISEKNNIGVFEFSPLPKGFGHTFGSSLRRVLLTSIKGGAITQAKFPGVTHKFSTISGIKEDVSEICLNLKEIRVMAHSDNPVVARINKKGKGPVTGADIEASSDFEIVNKDFQIAHISDDKTTFEAELIIESGVGYSPVEDRKTSKLGVILLDALFSPILNVAYTTELTRKGEITDLDKLIITIESDGSITPENALVDAATTFRNFLSRFAKGADPELEETLVEEVAVEATAKESKAKKETFLDDFALPTRTINALKNANINTLEELAKLSDDELADIKNLGSKSVKEIKKLLKKENLA